MQNTFTSEVVRTEFIRLVPSAGTPVRLTANTISNIARSAGNVGQRCVFTTASTHGALPGSVLVITSGGGDFVGEFVVTETPSSTTFVCMVPGTTNPGAVSYACYFRIRFRHAIVIGKNDWPTSNTGQVKIGGSSVVNQQPYLIDPYAGGGTGELRLGDPASPIYENLCNYWIDADNNGDGVIVRYI